MTLVYPRFTWFKDGLCFAIDSLIGSLCWKLIEQSLDDTLDRKPLGFSFVGQQQPMP
jgi:hypothetical protein